jgi:putative Mn2+ efflux pump MntP
MEFISILFIALGLSADCFAVAISFGLSNPLLSYFKQSRIALSFGAFQALMAYIGWLAGRTIVNLISEYDHWVAFSLLVLVGGRMIWEAVHHDSDGSKSLDISKVLPLLILSVATSIDALAVGLSLAFIEVNIATASITIGVVAFIITIAGLFIGRKASRILGSRAELIGGIILIAIGLRILIDHLI